MCKKLCEIEFDGKTFKIAQSVGRCCESGCSGCELFTYKQAHGFPIKNARAKFYESLASKLDKQKKS